MKKCKMRKILIILMILPSIAFSVYAHPGRTDAKGGHSNHSTGEYHYHHGYSAHTHYDINGDGSIDCPYDFDDKTSHNRSNDNDTTSIIKDASSPEIMSNSSIPTQISFEDILWAMFENLFLAISIWLSCSHFLFYIFSFIFGKYQGCSSAMIVGAIIALAMYIWLIVRQLS